jgi:hypothetical protein
MNDPWDSFSLVGRPMNTPKTPLSACIICSNGQNARFPYSSAKPGFVNNPG